MRIDKRTHPRRQARGCATKSKDMVAREGDLREWAIVGLVLFGLFVLPRILYAAMGWMGGI